MISIKNANDTSLFGDNRARDPPDPISNSEVKPCIADGSVGLPHVRVGHRQALFRVSLITVPFKTSVLKCIEVFFCL